MGGITEIGNCLVKVEAEGKGGGLMTPQTCAWTSDWQWLQTVSPGMSGRDEFHFR